MPDPSAENQSSYRPDLPDWGAYVRWPADDDAWIHPDDVTLAHSLIPSSRIFRRSMWDGHYYWLYYGDLRLRVRPTMWISVREVDLEVGQQVELLARHGENDAGIFRIREIMLASKEKEIDFLLRLGNMQIPRVFRRSDLRPLQTRHNLRSGFFKHQPPKSVSDANIKRLDVGDLLGD